MTTRRRGRASQPEPTLAYSQPRPMPYGSSPYAASVPPGADAPAGGRFPIGLADVWTALLGTVAVVIVGVLAGFLWLWIAPRPRGVVSATGGKSIQFDSANKVFASADVTFLFIGIGAGLLCGLVATILARRRGVAVSIAMAVGGTLASLARRVHRPGAQRRTPGLLVGPGQRRTASLLHRVDDPAVPGRLADRGLARGVRGRLVHPRSAGRDRADGAGACRIRIQHLADEHRARVSRQSLAMTAVVAFVMVTRSRAASSMSRPRRPAET